MSKNIDAEKLCRLSRLRLSEAQIEKTEEELNEFECFARTVFNAQNAMENLSADTHCPMREDVAVSCKENITEGYVEVPLTVGAEK